MTEILLPIQLLEKRDNRLKTDKFVLPVSFFVLRISFFYTWYVVLGTLYMVQSIPTFVNQFLFPRVWKNM
ncbi:hypothetical protein C943_04136 [Mariniradius saccharolyticus AK6]|uniref:Uncharacterized protein n=1 Tax=Mariniradius saccharolyticus AK6 TaxID=1239962 RepID=M7XZA7_9BACT|nr:hypothetical protein C943_04136 [Mariniradius saccharolyticus AK6]